ncbi:MAG: prolyl oligopeptidase family serine peptidase, partial [Actinomycetota bacterium]|nr:prolyl oligopeptidase family serine peptidase [Actinomycetota bacterium]
PGSSNWREIVSHREGVRIEDVDAFETFTVVTERRHGIPVLRVLDHMSNTEFEVEMDEPVFEAGPGANAEYATRVFRYGYTSMVTPPSTFEIGIDTLKRRLLKQQPVLGDADLSAYKCQRTWSTSADGVQVPVSLVWRPDAVTWPAPTLLYGYGAYEVGIPASFSSARLSLLDRGVVFAIAHVRGGGELGRTWYEQGRLEHKQNTFTDFGSCRDHLVTEGWSDPDRVVARGGSAGGLLMGAMVNQRPEAFVGVVAEVPFVDNVNTMLDPTIPLTITEYEEWGNPNDPLTFELMSSYGPYENVSPADHPALLITAGINDPRVQYWEPAKWVAKLRSLSTSELPILLRTELDSGHGGPSGRYDAWRDEAFVLSFVLDILNLA